MCCTYIVFKSEEIKILIASVRVGNNSIFIQNIIYLIPQNYTEKFPLHKKICMLISVSYLQHCMYRNKFYYTKLAIKDNI